MEQSLLMSIELAALNAWPAPRQMLYDGWLLRFTGGDSKRVNSVNLLGLSTLPLEEKICACEAIYARQGLPVIYRLADFLTPPELRTALASAGYTEFDPTFVLGREIDGNWVTSGDGSSNYEIRVLEQTDWLALRAWLMGKPLVSLGHHARVLAGIVPEKVLVGLFVEGEPAACGMGVEEGRLLGYFSIYTRARSRRRGYGRAVMDAITCWGVRQGARFGYLQVEGDNAPALALYEKMGYQPVYGYSYSKQ
jgi:GNAT superfamily N-acetyltransferase